MDDELHYDDEGDVSVSVSGPDADGDFTIHYDDDNRSATTFAQLDEVPDVVADLMGSPRTVTVELDAHNPDTLLEQIGGHDKIWVRPIPAGGWPLFAYRGPVEAMHAFLVDVYGMDPDEATELIKESSK